MPGGCTANYFFEFKKGVVCVRRLCSTKDVDGWSFTMCENPEKTKTAILTELFGSPDRKQALFENIKLPRHPGNVLDNKKTSFLV